MTAFERRFELTKDRNGSIRADRLADFRCLEAVVRFEAPQAACRGAAGRAPHGDLRLSNPDWNEYELLGGIRWLRAMLAASASLGPPRLCGPLPKRATAARHRLRCRS
jgi:hypothetical protein